MKTRRPVVLAPVRRELVSPAAYRKLMAEGSLMLERTKFIPPAFGAGGFGSFELHYAVPVLRPVKEKEAA